MSASDPAPRPVPSAGRWDLRRRYTQLAGVIVVIVAAVLIAMMRAPLVAVGIPAAILVIGAIGGSAICAHRASMAMTLERAAGYSTVIDAPGYELRDANTLALLRQRDVPPTLESRRSLALGIFGVKPGTVLAGRREEPGEPQPGEPRPDAPRPGDAPRDPEPQPRDSPR